MEEMGARLAKLRRENNLNQEELAEKLAVSRQAVSKWERGESTPDISNLIALAELYDVSIDYLAKGQDFEMQQAESSEEPEAREDVMAGAVDASEKPSSEPTNHESVEEWASPDPDSFVSVEQDASCEQPYTVTANAEKRRNSPLVTFPYPIVIVLLYLFMGFAFGAWHPWWMLFLTIPVYYWIVNVIINDPEYMQDHPQYKSSRGDAQ